MSDYDHTDALRFRAEADRWQKEANALRTKWEDLYAEFDALRTKSDALRAENAALKAQWQSVPWDALIGLADSTQFDDNYTRAADALAILDWAGEYAPKEEPTP